MAKNPLVLGLGFAAIRDFSSFLKYSLKDDSGFSNPLLMNESDSNPLKAAIMQGVSQCSNFARTFLFLGFNQDENRLKVFDGVNAHIGTRRISLNIRFGCRGGGGAAQRPPVPGQRSSILLGERPDPISGITGGILEKCIETGTCPKIIQTLSSSEYWQLRASLTTTDSYGAKDLMIPENVEYIYLQNPAHPGIIADQISGFS